ncbi:MAG TPA: hypothetical protein VLF67_04950 [Candidatus Saccharimonas sp.]|nr:hypothetical protein [Candidatus Saccharimonas sp.]
MRGYLVFDGDNYRASAKDANVELLPQHIDARVQEIGREHQIFFTRRVVFMSRHYRDYASRQWPLIEYEGSTDIEYRKYPIVGGHGYDDGQIIDLLVRQRDEYEYLVMVTSDEDFFGCLKWLARSHGKRVLLLCMKGFTNERSLRRLSPVQYTWVQDIPVPELAAACSPL